jgi:hypothetical protein
MTDYIKKSENYPIRAAYLFIPICLVVSLSCAGIGDKRYVENNTFISSYPKMAIKVNPELKYVGEYHGDIFKQATFDMDMRSAKLERVFHIFCQKASDGNAKRGIVISTYGLPGGYYWLSEPFTSEKGKKGKLDTGETEVAGMNWQYAMWTTKNFFGPAKDFVHDAGYSTTNQHLVFAIGRILTHEKDTTMLLYYVEDLEHCGYPHKMFSEGKSKFIDEFMQRGFNAFQFLK